MDHLWSPWRLEYVTGNTPDAGCALCEAPALPAQQSLLVFEGRSCYVILNLYPYNNGHVMVVPYRHVASLAALTDGELHEIATLVQRSEIAHQLPGLDDPGALNVSESEVHEGPSSLSRVRARKPMSRLSRLVLQTPEDRAEPRR